MIAEKGALIDQVVGVYCNERRAFYEGKPSHFVKDTFWVKKKDDMPEIRRAGSYKDIEDP